MLRPPAGKLNPPGGIGKGRPREYTHSPHSHPDAVYLINKKIKMGYEKSWQKHAASKES